MPVAYELVGGTLAPLLASDQETAISSIHMGWTAAGEDLVQVLGVSCGANARSGVAKLTAEGNLAYIWDGDGAAFRWRAAPYPAHPGDNFRERRLFAAIASVGAEACCEEPADGSLQATTGLVWEGIVYRITASDLATTGMITDPISQYSVSEVEVAVGANVPGERHLFACDDTIYSISNVIDGTTVSPGAVTALVGALGCNRPVVPEETDS
jgi:hypothetical protein